MPKLFDVDEALTRWVRSTQGPGFTAWIEREHLATAEGKPVRPWCRGRAMDHGAVIWFPRSSQRPRQGDRWAVHSPAGQLPRLGREGWFVVNAYVEREESFEPPGDVCGTLPEQVVENLYDKLDDFYWDSRL